MAESEELKSLRMKVKEKSEKVGLKLNIQKTKIMVSGPITSWQIDGETVQTVADYFSGLQNHCRWNCSHEIKRRLLLERKVMTNLDSILKSRDITLPTKVRLVKAMVFPVVMYGCESWTIKKAERRRIDAFELWCWRRLLRVSWTTAAAAAKSSQSCPTLCDPIDGSPLGSSVHSFFSRQEYWSGLPFPSLGDLHSPDIKPWSLVSAALAGRFFTTIATWEAII